MVRALALRHASATCISSRRLSWTGGHVGWMMNTSQPRMDSCGALRRDRKVSLWCCKDCWMEWIEVIESGNFAPRFERSSRRRRSA